MCKISWVFIKISAVLYWPPLFPIHKAHLGNPLQDEKQRSFPTSTILLWTGYEQGYETLVQLQPAELKVMGIDADFSYIW